MMNHKPENKKKAKPKKTRSIFLKIALIMTPIVLVLVLSVLFISYNITHENTIKSYKNQLRIAASNAVQYAESADMDNLEVLQQLNDDYNALCKLYDITYVYVLDIDPDESIETYIAIGFGSDATQAAKENRFTGFTVEGFVNDKEIEAINGNKDGVFSYEKSEFGDSLICYMPCQRFYDFNNKEYRKLDKPLVVGAELSLNAITKGFQHTFRWIAILTIVLTLVIVGAFVLLLYFRVSKPVRKISSKMSSFVTDREAHHSVEKLEVKGNDEFTLMASSFNVMVDEIDSYINDIDSLNREKHTQEAEMNIARSIQTGLLQPDLDTDAYHISAYMLPAKEVGGDLYDYRLLDDGRIFIAIADVSGKGISASLFMAHAITLLHQYAAMDFSPAHILETFNNTISAQNPGGMFITAFIAMYDPMKHELVYSNAGHNFPYILSDRVIPLEDAHGVAAGLFSGETYENAVVKMKTGDALYLYTDGVNEAKNAANEFYGEERLEKMLSLCIASDKTDTINTVLGDLKEFSEGAEQNDDITMLRLSLKEPPSQITLKLASEVAQFKKIKKTIYRLPISEDMKKTLILGAEEVFVNICSYAYDTPGEVEITITLGDTIGLIFADKGKPFDPTVDVQDIDEYDHENRIGGLGRFLIFSIADEYTYAYKDNKNILSLYFNNEVKQNDDNERA